MKSLLALSIALCFLMPSQAIDHSFAEGPGLKKLVKDACEFVIQILEPWVEDDAGGKLIDRASKLFDDVQANVRPLSWKRRCKDILNKTLSFLLSKPHEHLRIEETVGWLNKIKKLQ